MGLFSSSAESVIMVFLGTNFGNAHTLSHKNVAQRCHAIQKEEKNYMSQNKGHFIMITGSQKRLMHYGK